MSGVVGWGTGLQGRARADNTDEGGQDEGERQSWVSTKLTGNSELGRQD